MLPAETVHAGAAITTTGEDAAAGESSADRDFTVIGIVGATRTGRPARSDGATGTAGITSPA